METVLKAVRMKPELIKDIKKEADKEDRNFSNMVIALIKRGLKTIQS